VDNDIIVEAWNTVLFEKFTKFRDLFVSGYSLDSEELLRRRPYQLGKRVLDLGCGWGNTTLRIAEQVGYDR